MRFFLLCNPYCWPSDTERSRFAARNTDRYQEMLEGVVALAQVLERADFEAIGFSEQHAFVEGVPEVTGNPLYLSMHVAAHTERIKVGSMGRVITVNNPLLIAEEIAMLDQMTKGRAIAGMARGNTPRWIDQFGQHINVRYAPSDKSPDDLRNRAAYEEAWEIILRAWTQDTFSYDGEIWKLPTPGSKWPYPPTREWGGGIDEDGNLLEIGIAPRPFQTPHPRIFAPLSKSSATVRMWAKANGSILTLANNDDFIQGMLDLYAEQARSVGREVRRGEGILPGGVLALAPTESAARAIAERFERFYLEFYGIPPYQPAVPRMFVGTPEKVLDEIGSLKDKLGVEEVLLWGSVGAPHGIDGELEQYELFGSEVAKHLV